MDLSRRAVSVLCAVVDLYIRSGVPVASRQVARHSGLGLSPATMRNVMAELEEAGFLGRPHPSAGSVPSDQGFRVYVDRMPRPRTPPATVRRELDLRMDEMRRELVEDIEWAAKLIAEVTKEAGVALRPMGDGPLLEAVSLVLLDDRRVLGVVVTGDGAIEKKIVELDHSHSREGLQNLANRLTQGLSGRSIRAIEVHFGATASVDGATEPLGLDESCCEVARQLFGLGPGEVEVRIAGTENLLGTTDFAEVDRIRSLLTTLQDRARIAEEFRRAFAHGRTHVFIGNESEATASGNLGMVGTLFFRDGRRAGALGVVGPRRMDYLRIVPVVEYIGDTLTQMLESSGERHA